MLSKFMEDVELMQSAYAEDRVYIVHSPKPGSTYGDLSDLGMGIMTMGLIGPRVYDKLIRTVYTTDREAVDKVRKEIKDEGLEVIAEFGSYDAAKKKALQFLKEKEKADKKAAKAKKK